MQGLPTNRLDFTWLHRKHFDYAAAMVIIDDDDSRVDGVAGAGSGEGFCGGEGCGGGFRSRGESGFGAAKGPYRFFCQAVQRETIGFYTEQEQRYLFAGAGRAYQPGTGTGGRIFPEYGVLCGGSCDDQFVERVFRALYEFFESVWPYHDTEYMDQQQSMEFYGGSSDQQ